MPWACPGHPRLTTVIPGRCAAPNPESRDSESGPFAQGYWIESAAGTPRLNPAIAMAITARQATLKALAALNLLGIAVTYWTAIPKVVVQDRRPAPIYRLERAAGCGIIAESRGNSAHLHRP